MGVATTNNVPVTEKDRLFFCDDRLAMNNTLPETSCPGCALISKGLLAIVAGAHHWRVCQTTGGGYSALRAKAAPKRLASNGQHQDAASAYIELAAQTTGQARERLTLLAVEQWLDAGDATRARNAFTGMPIPIDAQLRHLWKTNSATLLLFRGEADEALGILEALSRESLTRNRRLRVDALRADAWVQKQDPTRAIELMTQRESLLSDRRDIAETAGTYGRPCCSVNRRTCAPAPS